MKNIGQEPCEDAISRQAVLKAIKNLYPGIPFVDINGARLKWLRKYKPYFECEKVVEQLPSITPQQKTGRWIDRNCSRCGCRSMLGLCIENYCANCGAKMTRRKEDDKEPGKKTE